MKVDEDSDQPSSSLYRSPRHSEAVLDSPSQFRSNPFAQTKGATLETSLLFLLTAFHHSDQLLVDNSISSIDCRLKLLAFTSLPSRSFWSHDIVARTVAACSPPITEVRHFGHMHRNRGLQRSTTPKDHVGPLRLGGVRSPTEG